MKRAVFIGFLSLLPISNMVMASIDDFDIENESEELVYTPSRMKQAVRDVPGFVSVISKEDIKLYSITSIKDALQRLAGIVVSDRGSDAVVTYRGLNTVLSRRVNVQVNGITLFDPAIATVPWNTLPVSIYEVERIEVSKSPNAASYGSNSFLTVVNIITESPVNSDNKIVGTIDNDKTGSALYRFNHKGEKTAFNVTVSHDKNDGYDRSDMQQARYRGQYESTRINFESITDFNSTDTLKLYAYGTKSERGSGLDTSSPIFPNPNEADLELTDYNFLVKYKKSLKNHELTFSVNHYQGDVHQEGEVCLPLVWGLPEFTTLYNQNRDYAEAVALGTVPTGGSVADDLALAAYAARVASLGAAALTPYCGLLTQNIKERRDKVELQDIYSPNEKLRISSTFSVSHEEAESETYLNGIKPSVDIFSVSLNAEYKPTPKYTLNFGAFIEDSNNTDDIGFTPRFGINYHLTPNQTVRAAITRSERSPDIFEQNARWIYNLAATRPNALGLTNITAPGSAISPGNIKSEKITSFELGHYWKAPSRRFQIDTKIFRDELSDLISTYLKLYDFDANNRGETTLTGIEIESSYQPTTTWGLKSAFAYLDNDSNTVEERTTYKRLSGSLSAYKILTDTLTGSLSYTGASNDDSTTSTNLYSANLGYNKGKISAAVFVKYNPRPETKYVMFPSFPNLGWRTGILETLRNEDKTTIGLTGSYRW